MSIRKTTRRGMTVITSKELDKIPVDLVMEYKRDDREDYIVWYFNSVTDAQNACQLFMNAGFEYVQREV